jgi:hypothetical protein
MLLLTMWKLAVTGNGLVANASPPWSVQFLVTAEDRRGEAF